MGEIFSLETLTIRKRACSAQNAAGIQHRLVTLPVSSTSSPMESVLVFLNGLLSRDSRHYSRNHTAPTRLSVCSIMCSGFCWWCSNVD